MKKLYYFVNIFCGNFYYINPIKILDKIYKIYVLLET